MRDSIYEKIGNKPWLRLIEHDVLGVAERIRDIEDGYFIVFNIFSGRFEVHSTYNIGNSFCCLVPHETLDARTLEYVRRTNIASRGDDVFKEIEEENAKLEAQKERHNRNELEDSARELQGITKLAVSGYSPTHVMKGADTN